MCVGVCVFVCMCVCVYVFVFVCVCVCVNVFVFFVFVCVCLCVFVFVSVCLNLGVCVCEYTYRYTGTDTSLRCNLRVVEIRRTCTQLSSERDIFGQAHSVSLFCCHYWADSRPKVDRDNPNTDISRSCIGQLN